MALNIAQAGFGAATGLLGRPGTPTTDWAGTNTATNTGSSITQSNSVSNAVDSPSNTATGEQNVHRKLRILELFYHHLHDLI